MSIPNSTSLAALNAVGVKNVQFQPIAENVPRKILIIGTYDPLKTLVVDEVPVRILSPEDAGDRFGFGFMIHRLAVQVFKGSQGVECWVSPQTETSAQAAGSHAFTASGLLAGTVYMYIAGIPVPFDVATGDTSDEVATKAAAAITAIKELPVAAVVGTPTNLIDIISKSEGTWGDEISLLFNRKVGEVDPVGLSVVTVDMTAGAGTPTIADALNGLGTGDDANEDFFTDVVHGYLQDTATLDAISTYVGAGNEFIGLYGKEVARPFRVLTGDVAAGSAGLNALTAVGGGRKLDRASGIIAVPGSSNHPSEIAAQAIGHMARINNNLAEQSVIDVPLIDIDPGDKADRWTSQYVNRDTAVKAGISTSQIKNGVVTLQDMVTFYHPDSVPVSSNGYRDMRNISILQNTLNSTKVNFAQPKWQGISIVSDTTLVTSFADRKKARDISSVKDDLTALAKAWEAKAWIFSARFTIEQLQAPGSVVIREGARGFDSTLKIILSGKGGIINTEIEFDTSVAVFF